MRYRFHVLFLGIALAFMQAILQPASAGTNCAAGVRVQKAAQDFMRAARTGSRAALRRTLLRHVDMRGVMNFALGRSIRRLKGAQRSQYYRRANAYAVRRLAQLAKHIHGNRVEVVRCKGNRVVTRLLPQREKVIWKLRGGRVIDVNVRGVWVAQMLRGQFRRMLRESNDNMQVFLARLN